MNELGARHFDRYVDADGADLRGDAIGTWDEVAAAAASFVSTPAAWPSRSRSAGRALCRGRELIGSRLAWSGFGYSLPPRRAAVRLRGARSSGPHELGAAHLPVLPALARPLALPLPAARRRLRRRRPAGGRPRGELLDCTFLSRDEALAGRAGDRRGGRRHLLHGDDARGLPWFADALRGHCDLLVAGGPLPTCDPGGVPADTSTSSCAARASRRCSSCSPPTRPAPTSAPCRGRGAGRATGAGRPVAVGGGAAASPTRRRARSPRDLDAHPLPRPRPAAQRRLHPLRPARVRPLDHDRHEHARLPVPRASSAATSCSATPTASARPGTWSTRSSRPSRLGYDRISFADDVFTLNRGRVRAICDEIGRRGLRFALGVPGPRRHLRPRDRARDEAGRLLPRLLRHRVGQRRHPEADEQEDHGQPGAGRRWRAPTGPGWRSGAFFILCYPGETDDTVLDTLRFAASLPLDYVGLTMPYPLPGTALLDRVGDRLTREWRPQESARSSNHVLTFEADFSATKMRFALLKGRAQFEMRRRLGQLGAAGAQARREAHGRLFRLLQLGGGSRRLARRPGGRAAGRLPAPRRERRHRSRRPGAAARPRRSRRGTRR